MNKLKILIKLLCLPILVMMLLSSCTSTLIPSDKSLCSVSVPADGAFVYNMTTDNLVLYSHDGSDSTVYPASITKLAVSLYALETMPADTVISPGEETYFPNEGSSSAYIRPNHTLTLEMLIEGMLIPSGNDAAYAVAVSCGRVIANDDTLSAYEAVEVFMDGLNEYVTSLGCVSTHFTTPDGFTGDEHYSSISDMAIISRAAVENELIMRYAGLFRDDVTYASGHINQWVNTNEFLNPASKHYNENVIGLKTGSTDKNYCLVTVYDDGDERYIIGVFGCPTDDSRYTAAEILMENN